MSNRDDECNPPILTPAYLLADLDQDVLFDLHRLAAWRLSPRFARVRREDGVGAPSGEHIIYLPEYPLPMEDVHM